MKNQLKRWIMRACIALVVIGCTLGACTAVNKWLGVPDDNPIEEIVEQQIKNQTGFDVDLSPESPEGK